MKRTRFKAITLAVGDNHVWHGYTGRRSEMAEQLVADPAGGVRAYTMDDGAGDRRSVLVIEFRDDYTAAELARYLGGAVESIRRGAAIPAVMP